MSATYSANVQVVGNVIVQGAFSNCTTASGNVTTTYGGVSLAVGIGAGSAGSTSGMIGIIMNDGTVRVCGLNDNGQLGQNDLTNRSTVVSVLGISSQAVAVAHGFLHTAIIMNDGTVRVCGDNTNGALGVNDTTNRSTVVSVFGISSQAIALSCGIRSTLVLINNGTVRAFGLNNRGQLGQNNTTNKSTPVPVIGISSQAVAVACGSYHTAILMNDGTVRVCGDNRYGQLGQNDSLTTRSTVVSVLGISSQAIAISAGIGHLAILMNDGTVRVCGRNDEGQLGQNDLTTRSTVVSVLGISSQAIAISAGGYHTAILMNDGTVRVCGNNRYGQLGQNDTTTRSTVVSVLGISSQAIAVACGRNSTIILLNDGTVRVCGINSSGQLGQNDLTQRNTPVPVLYVTSTGPTISILEQNPVTFVGTGHYTNMFAAVMNDGTVRVCGGNSSGQLGQNDIVTSRSTVVSVLGISSQAISVSLGRYHTAILMNDGTVRTCGQNANGQLGQNDLTTRSTVVSILGISSQAIAVACGQVHTLILMNDGTVRGCGKNQYGQLGQNDTSNRSTVVSVLGISSQAIAVAGGQEHTAILMNDGTVRVCGLNTSGQLGQNDVSDRSTVVSVLGISSQAIGVACGQRFTAILMSDGTVRVCGINSNGQLGQNDTVTTRSTVVSVLGISSQAIAIACGGQHLVILMSDGTVRVCGDNSRGQLGQNNLSDRSTVVSVLGISTAAVAIACGVYSTSILMSDGTVRVCGRNEFGQLGQNDVLTRSTVVTVVLGMPTNAILVAPALNLGPVPVTSFQLDMSTDNARKLTTSTWTTGSDEALKTNIINADLDRCVEIVSNLDLKYFKWDGVPSDDAHSLGWIAQEVAQFFPKAVTTEEANGIPDFKNLNSDQLIKVMWGALKKLRADLKAKQTV